MRGIIRIHMYVLHPVGKQDRTHPRARACARKATRPRAEYFIFTYQRWALCAVYIKSRYSYGMSIRRRTLRGVLRSSSYIDIKMKESSARR